MNDRYKTDYQPPVCPAPSSDPASYAPEDDPLWFAALMAIAWAVPAVGVPVALAFSWGLIPFG